MLNSFLNDGAKSFEEGYKIFTAPGKLVMMQNKMMAQARAEGKAQALAEMQGREKKE
jgi:hypothetical protein